MKLDNVNSNIFYLIPSILAILKEYYISSLIYFTMFVVSSIYHGVPKTNNPRNIKKYKEYQKIDMIVAYLLIINNTYIIYKNYKKHPIICLTSALIAIFSFGFYDKYACADNCSNKIYNLYHPYWHISTGIGSAILFLY